MELAEFPVAWQFGKIIFPDKCCLCGGPLAHTIRAGGRMQRTWYGLLGRRVTTTWGSDLIVPYCTDHHIWAEKTLRVVRRFRDLSSYLFIGIIIAAITLNLIFGPQIWTYNPRETAFGMFLIDLFTGALAGAFIAALSEPLLRALLGGFLPLFLPREVRADLKTHMKAHKQPEAGKTLIEGSVVYAPGFSLDYRLEESGPRVMVREARVLFTCAGYAEEFRQRNQGIILVTQ